MYYYSADDYYPFGRIEVNNNYYKELDDGTTSYDFFIVEKQLRSFPGRIAYPVPGADYYTMDMRNKLTTMGSSFFISISTNYIIWC